ncbi:ABC-F family ATP-binding cassette domain-containing protein [Pseudoclavibacter soli]|uniref:ABC-F family ATP-binding cassette domain-containing protein n=1 Tax=Pseudoclavibacter soli TaxID=452623 RepID=UPI000421FE46|nr:ATP-binding cassette domain-containing protein [Pseudoclavibacter soli]
MRTSHPNTPHSADPSVTLHDVSFTWPDGRSILVHANAAFGRTRTGLVGDNGVGKSTVLALLAGQLQPTDGRITRAGTIVLLPQRLDVTRSVADLLGVRGVLDAISEVESGALDPALFERIGNDWDIEARAVAALVGVQLAAADITLLDEPTNNLDAEARTQVLRLIDNWRGALVVVSHDRELLEHVDAIAELRAGTLTIFGGAFSEHEAQVEREQLAAERALRGAEQTLRTERRQRAQAEQRIAHSERQGRTDVANRKYVKAVVNDRRNSAQKAQASRRHQLDDRLATAQRSIDAADARVRDDEHIVIDLPAPAVPAGRRIARFVGADGREFVVNGAERVAITGRNGVGKSTLLAQLLRGADSEMRPGVLPDPPRRASGELFVGHVGYLSQSLDNLHDEETVFENVARTASGLEDRVLRNQLARLLLRGRMMDAPVASLSGGQRFRVALAQLLLATPPVQALVLDEPTNSLDMASVDQLVEALSAYRGAVIVVSHDHDFLSRVSPDLELHLEPDGVLTQR